MRRTLSRAWLVLVTAGWPALAACESGGTPGITELRGEWVLESIEGRPIDSKSRIYFEIGEETISGYDGCNSFGGKLDALDRLRRGQRACPAEVLQIRFSDLKTQFESLKVEGDALDLVLADDAGKARFRKVLSR